MKKGYVIGIILLFVGASIIPSMSGTTVEKQISKEDKSSLIGFNPRGDTLYVGGSGPGNYSKIQDAIDNASNGDTVFVYNGIYYGKVEVDKSINLIGEDKNTTVINGDNHTVVRVYADWVKISGFTLQNSGVNYVGIRVTGYNNTTIAGNIVTACYVGICIQDHADHNTIIGNTLSGNGVGISVVYYSFYTTITGNNVTENEDGINIYWSYTNCTYNTVSDNYECGIRLMSGGSGIEYINVIGNTITNNSYSGIRLINSIYNSTISNNIINSNDYSGIYKGWGTSDNNVITGNTISFNNDYGIYFRNKEGTDLLYHNNFIGNIPENAYDNRSNTWDNGYPSGGNYWDDYNGTDSDGDGIGDTPYNISGGSNQDLYPLMAPWSGGNIPDLDCSGTLSWTSVTPGSTVTGSFTVENIGEPLSMLDWEITEYPDWGTWTFVPDSGEDLTPEDGVFTIEVEVVAPDDPETDFTGHITIVNSEDGSDFCIIDVLLATPVSQQVTNPLLQMILERFPNAFPILRQLLGL